MEEEGALAARVVAAGLAAPPALPGVYRFRDGAGGLVYLGSSRDLGRRVRSYFAPGHAAASKTARIARLAARVEWRACRSVLEARVLEARAIRDEQPRFNRRLKQTGTCAYVRIDAHDPFPRLEVTRRLVDGWRAPRHAPRRLGREAAWAQVLARAAPGPLFSSPARRARV